MHVLGFYESTSSDVTVFEITLVPSVGLPLKMDQFEEENEIYFVVAFESMR